VRYYTPKNRNAASVGCNGWFGLTPLLLGRPLEGFLDLGRFFTTSCSRRFGLLPGSGVRQQEVPERVDRIAAAARPVFKLLGHEDHLKVEHPDCEHDFPSEMREAAYKLFDKILGGT
jgi:hypothetical protein